jgi:hypothetical protein
VKKHLAFGIFLLASSSAGAACDNFETARNAAYMPYMRLVSEEIAAAQMSDSGTSTNTTINRLAAKYEQYTRVGDLVALRKLIALDLFTAFAAKREPLDVTFKLTCELARKPRPPENVIDPLVCATIALDGSRRGDAANRSIATDMIDRAKKNLATDRDPAGARGLFDTIAPVVLACAAAL